MTGPATYDSDYDTPGSTTRGPSDLTGEEARDLIENDGDDDDD